MTGPLTGPATTGWLPAGITAGQSWACQLGLTDPATGQPRIVYRCWAELGRPRRFGGYTQLLRLDDSARPDRGTAHPAGRPANQVLLSISDAVSAGLPACEDAQLEVWIQPSAAGEPYCLLRAPFPIRPKAADLP